MHVKSVDFLLTFRCPSRCKHCSYKAGPERIGYMKLTEAEEYLKELTGTQPLETICAHGGEPFLYFQLLKQIVEKAKKLEVPQRWVITNGYWAKNQKTAIKKLTELKDAGLTHITFSVDSFHQEYVPLEMVRKGVKAAISIGFERICVDSHFLVGSNSNNSHDNLTKKALESLEGLDEIEINRYPTGFEGRGTELAKYAEPRSKPPTGKCTLPFWIGGNLESPETIEIDLEGNVTLCPGICIGNTRVQSLTAILQNYDCHTHPILSIIAKEGPIGLLKNAISKGFHRHQKFIDECHLCYEMRRFLMRHYPQHLAPADCY